MAERTVNGKSLKQIAEELSKPFDPSDFKQNRYEYYYLPVEVYRQRMDEVVGVLNYDFETSEPRITVVGTKPHISLSGKITIKDDEGNVVTKKSSCGGSQVIMSNTSNEPVLLKNDLESASSDVFKRCCKGFGMGNAQLKELRKKGKDQKEFVGINPEEPIALYRVTLREAFSSVGKKGYGAMVDIEGESEPHKLMIWQNGKEEIEKHISFSKFIQFYGVGKSFSLYGYKYVFHKKNNQEELQLVLERPFTGSEEGS